MLFEQNQFAFDTRHNGDAAPQVRFSMRARRLSVRVHRDARVEVVAPPRTSERRIVAFVAQHARWIEAQRVRARDRAPQPTRFPPTELALPALDETWKVHLTGGGGATRIRELTPGILNVTGRADDAALKAALRRWLVRHGQPAVAPLLTELALAMGTEFQRLSLRFQRSRWGSCSVRGTISLNVAMLFQSPEVARYLMVHELTHLRHANHSARFWCAVEKHCSDWRRLDRELTQGWRRVPTWLFQ